MPDSGGTKPDATPSSPGVPGSSKQSLHGEQATDSAGAQQGGGESGGSAGAADRLGSQQKAGDLRGNRPGSGRRPAWQPQLPKFNFEELLNQLFTNRGLIYLALFTVGFVALWIYLRKRRSPGIGGSDAEAPKIDLEQVKQSLHRFELDVQALLGQPLNDPEAARMMIVRVYNLLLQHFERSGCAKDLAETPDEYSLQKIFRHKVAAPLVHGVTRDFCAAYYGRMAPSQQQLQEFLKKAAHLGALPLSGVR
jgi:hypothetical protein